jgi:hypothetical protein
MKILRPLAHVLIIIIIIIIILLLDTTSTGKLSGAHRKFGWMRQNTNHSLRHRARRNIDKY